MPQSKKQIHAKKAILSAAVKYKHPSFPTRIIHEDMGLDYPIANGMLHQLISENLVEYVNGQKDLIILTESGIRAEKVGYDIYINEIAEKEHTRQQNEVEKNKLELDKLRFDFKTRGLVYVSIGLSILSLVVSIVTWYFPKK